MPGNDKPTGRVVAVIVLVLVTAAALRGYLPGSEHPTEETQSSSPVTVIAIIALVGASVAIIGIAIVARLRDRRPGAAAHESPRSFGAGGWRPTWRFMLIVLGVLGAWLLLIWMLSGIGPQYAIDQPLPPEDSDSEVGAPSAEAEPPPEPSGLDEQLFGYLAAATVVFVLLVMVGALLARRNRSVPTPYVVAGKAPAPAPPTPAAESLARAAEVGLAEIENLSREPREAIIACYAAMERELSNVPGAVPQDFDTPSEVLARAVDLHALQPDSATQLVDLFEEARFSPHVMNEGHRDMAVDALRLVLNDLRSTA